MTEGAMSVAGLLSSPTRSGVRALRLLWRDKFALVSAVFLLLVILSAFFGPLLLGNPATSMNLRMRNAAPFSLENGWLFFLGADTLGRSILARIIVASQNTMAVATGAAFTALLFGAVLGLIAGVRRGQTSNAIMRFADILMSFPSLLLALVVLYILQPSVLNVIFILAVTRMPVFLRTVRAETLEIRERLFVMAARALGASEQRIIFRHILPVAFPTLITLFTLELGFMMLAEAGLSFLGLGIQPPEITWGLMVADGRNYLASAWWLAFWPGLAIMLTTISLVLLSNWLSLVANPQQRWRLERRREGSSVDLLETEDE
jgi:peptide/nickel transport system permease protein